MKVVLNSSDPSAIEQIAHYLPYRAFLSGNFKQQLIPSTKSGALPASSQGSQEDVQTMTDKPNESKSFAVSGDLADAFRGTTSSREDQRGILERHTIGKQKL